MSNPKKNDTLAIGEFQHWTTSETGIRFNPTTPEDEWTRLTTALCGAFAATDEAHASLMFRIGDALAFGEEAYGERYAQAIDLTRERLRLSAKTIENVAIICRNVPQANRRFLLTLSHYEAVQTLAHADQEALLEEAEQEGDSVATLKTKVARIKLSDQERAAIASVTQKPIDEMTAQEIKGALRAAGGKKPKESAVIDMDDPEQVLFAIEKAGRKVASYDFAEFSADTVARWQAAVDALVEAFEFAAPQTKNQTAA